MSSLVLYCRVLSYRSVKQAQIAGGRATFFATSLYQVSSVTELWCAVTEDMPVSFAYYMTDTW